MSEQTTKWRWVRLFCAVLLTPFAHALAYPQGATSYTAAAVYFLVVGWQWWEMARAIR